mmetsp:Transcript_10732/g.38843  ORF Transcript_10732/g.38843 Transcript_10732/m.38843 type:complete len:203 (+) Transcript_10732:87-695(+)
MHASNPCCHHGLSPYSASANASTAAADGAHAPTAPACCAAMAAAAHPTLSACGTPAPDAQDRKNPALNASPAPFVSTTLDTVHAGAFHRPPSRSPARTPAAPRLMTTSLTPSGDPFPPPSPSATPSNASSASSAVGFPVISHASTSEGSRTSTAEGPLIASFIARLVQPPFASKLGSIDTTTPRLFSRRTTPASPPCTPSQT